MAKSEEKSATKIPGQSYFGAKTLVTIATGFAPYWEPRDGAVIEIRPRMIDSTDPNFLRIICENLGGDVECSTGPKDKDGDAEPVAVHNGEDMTISWFAALPLEFALKDGVPLRVTALGKTKSGTTSDGKPKYLWHFRYETYPEDQKKIMSEKARAMGFGPRDPKGNPLYLQAFTPEGLTLAGPTADMRRLADGRPVDAER